MAKYLDSNGLLYLWGKIKTTFLGDVSYDTSTRKLSKTKNGTTSDLVTLSTVATSGSYNDLSNKPTTPTVPSAYTSNPAMDGTASAGSSTQWAKGDHVHPSDTSRAPVGHASSSDTYGKGTSSNYGHVKLSDAIDGTSAAADGGTAATPKAVSDALQAAYSYADSAAGDSNQNAFSNVKIGSTTIAADTETDTLELAAGSNVTLTPDATNDKVTIASTDTKNTAGSTDSSSKLFLIGATSQAANPQTYSQDTAYVGTDGHLYSNSVQVVNLSGSQALTNKTYNGYTLAAACAKGVDTSISSGSTSTNLPTSAAVVKYIGEVAGALVYKGTVSAASGMANFKKGWFWIAADSFTIGSGATADNVEPGDMLIANADGTSATAANIDVVQTNIETLSNDEIDALWAAA